MDPHPAKQTQPERAERISLAGYVYKKSRFFAVFLICCGLMIAGFAISGVWRINGNDWLRDCGSFLPDGPQGTGEAEASDSESTGEESTPALLEEQIPQGAVKVVNADLCGQSGFFIDNQTLYDPNLEAILLQSV
ncbi:MAG: hypothetical protein IJX13_01470, partial [Clostridia bacterium]|nr:hypothetical protein [Clostridia bacterium]